MSNSSFCSHSGSEHTVTSALVTTLQSSSLPWNRPACTTSWRGETHIQSSDYTHAVWKLNSLPHVCERDCLWKTNRLHKMIQSFLCHSRLWLVGSAHNISRWRCLNATQSLSKTMKQPHGSKFNILRPLSCCLLANLDGLNLDLPDKWVVFLPEATFFDLWLPTAAMIDNYVTGQNLQSWCAQRQQQQVHLHSTTHWNCDIVSHESESAMQTHIIINEVCFSVLITNCHC